MRGSVFWTWPKTFRACRTASILQNSNIWVLLQQPRASAASCPSNKRSRSTSATQICRTVSKEVSLCLFRVLQEALQNAVRHSGMRLFAVELRGTDGEIQLTVSDQGVGFDPHDAINRHGLGLISMRERMQLVGGQISIQSQPGGGTTIHARAPFEFRERFRRSEPDISGGTQKSHCLVIGPRCN